MTTEERDQLLTDSAQVRDETVNKANTALRVGTLFTNIVNFAYKAWLGITDETTHLLTPKEIREGSGADTKLITSAEADNKIATEVPTESAQFSTEAGIAYLDTPFLPRTVTSVTFNRSQIFGEETLPIYNFLSISKTGAKHENKCLVIHSSLIVPEILMANKPDSPRELPYDNQDAMTADFAEQTEGEYYYYTGSTSAWLYDGTATDSIDNYTELTEPSDGWEEWGTRPSWLKVTGTYLVGSANINYLHFQYFKSKSGNTTDFDFVECNVVSLDNGNLDPNSDIVNLIVDLKYNENVSPVEQDTLINDSIYASVFDPIIENPTEAFYEDLGSGNYAIAVGTTNNSFTIRAFRTINFDFDYSRIFASEKITILSRLKILNSGTTQERIICGNYTSASPRAGFRFSITASGQLKFEVGDGSAGGSTFVTTATNVVTEDSGYHVVAVTFEFDPITKCSASFYRKSSARNLDFEFIQTITNSNTRSIVSDFPLRLDKGLINATTSRPKYEDQLLVWVDKISSFEELETIAIELDGPNNSI
jgi:hypothetical protein